MTRRRIATAAGLVALLVFASAVALVAGLVAGATYTLTREAQSDALITTAAVARVRDGRLDEAIGILEGSLEIDLMAHWGGFSLEDAAPEVWVFRPIPLDGLRYAARYLDDHPDPERNDFVQSIIACHLQPDLPDPHEEMAAHRKAIRSCYASLQ